MEKKKELINQAKKPDKKPVKEKTVQEQKPVKEKTVQEQIAEAGNNKENIINLIKSWLPEGTKKAIIRFAGDKMYLIIIDKTDKEITLPPQKLNMFFKFALTRQILKLTTIRDYEFIECNVDFIKGSMSGVQYFIQVDKKTGKETKYKKSFNI